MSREDEKMRNSIHLISTGKQKINEFVQNIKEAYPYIDYIHLREKDWSAKDYLEAIYQLVHIGISREQIIINDRVDIAVTEELYGVQLTSHSLSCSAVKTHFPQLKVGCSVHSLVEAKEKEEAGADYLIYGHVFKTKSKIGKKPKGVNKLKKVINQTELPIIAIGGIKPNNVKEIFDVGADGIAVLSGILLTKDVKNQSSEYYKEINNGVK